MYTPTRKRWRAWPECTPWRSVGTSPRSRRQHSSEAMMHDRFLSHFLIERPNQPDAVLYPKSSTHTLEKCFPGKRIRKSSSDLPKSSRGQEISFVALSTLPIPKRRWWNSEDSGRPNEPFRVCVRSTFQRFFAQISYSYP